MSDHKHDNNHEQVEASGVKAKPILVFLAVLGVATAMVYLIIVGVQAGLKKVDEMNPQQPETAIQSGKILPPEPRLQGAPEPDPDQPGKTKNSMLPLEDMAAYRAKVNKQAASYGWVDQANGVAYIPIDRAKELIAEKGLPKLSDAMIGEYQTAETARKQVLNAVSSSGRLIKSQKPAVAPTPAGAETAKPPSPAPETGAAKPAAKAAASAKQ
ncbi:MAG: hypothetical protein JST85_14390 [Acidobacteria bacterium]|nr:hypothetical protein [Acidobacteriota bacterium]